jgi:hypothetical protein
MPTLLYLNGFRFFFYSNESNELIHVHVIKGDGIGKIWLEPQMKIGYFKGFTKSEEKYILEMVAQNFIEFKKQWNAYFSK